MLAVLKAESVEFEATVTSKGQITLPIALRESFGITAGTKVKFIQDASGVRFEAQKPISAYRGILKHLGPFDTTIPKEADRNFDDIPINIDPDHLRKLAAGSNT